MTDEEKFYLRQLYSDMAVALRALWKRYHAPHTHRDRKRLKGSINKQITNMRQLRNQLEEKEVG